MPPVFIKGHGVRTHEINAFTQPRHSTELILVRQCVTSMETILVVGTKLVGTSRWWASSIIPTKTQRMTLQGTVPLNDLPCLESLPHATFPISWVKPEKNQCVQACDRHASPGKEIPRREIQAWQCMAGLILEA